MSDDSIELVPFENPLFRERTTIGASAEVLPLIPRSNHETPVFDKIFATASDLASRSSYKIQMDLKVYRDLEIRNQKINIRGGITFKSPLKLVNHHSSCRQCHYSLEIDSYGRGCIHNCSYCYAKEQLTRYGYWNEPIPVPLDISELHKIFYTVFETQKPHKWRDVLEQRVPFRVGSMSDSFMWMDKKFGVTLEMLKIFNHYEYPYIIFTRSDLVAEENYLKNIDPKLGAVQMSISSINDTLNKKIEPGAPSAKRRLSALQSLSEAGIWTSVRINPLFLMYPDGYFTDPDFDRKNATHLDYFSWDLVDAIADHKIPSFLAGVVRLNPVALKQFSAACGVDYSTFFKKESLNVRGDKRFSDAEVGYYYRRLAAQASYRGIRFSTCYIGNGEKDYVQYQDLWSNKSDCCDVRGNVSGFKVSSQEIPEQVRMKHSPQSARAPKQVL